MKKSIFPILASLSMALTASAAATAQFPGGESALNEFIAANMKYPEPAARNGIEGVVTVECVVKADGSIGTIKIVRMIDPDLEQEAIRLVKSMPAWTPADNNGSPVDSSVTIPITFTLPE